MSDLIDRQKVLDVIQKKADEIDSVYSAFWEGLKIAQSIVEKVPSAKPESEEFEWCHDCKEYDQEQHCCHRWTKVIRQTVDEVKSKYALGNPKIIHCEDCKWWDRLEEGHPYGDCRACRSGTQTERWDIHIQRQCKFDFYCADAEPIEDEVTDDQA